VAELLALDLVPVKIDQDEMAGGLAVAAALRGQSDGGIPWYVIIDPARGRLIERPDGSLTIDPAALLATADGPEGNVGCPVTPSERAHFLDTLDATRRNLTDEQLSLIAADLHAFARETIGAEADAD
jgi:hypothetical protein